MAPSAGFEPAFAAPTTVLEVESLAGYEGAYLIVILALGQRLELRFYVPKTFVLPLDEPRINLARGGRLELPFHGPRPRVLPLDEPRMDCVALARK